MCLLTYLPPDVMPDTYALFIGAEINDDGHGFAIVAGGRIIVRHGMYAHELIDEFEATRRRHPHGPALFHSRLGTHGDRTLANCHPFPVGGDHRTVLAHNGILPTAVQPAKGDPRSDTRITAEQFLPAFGSLRSRRTRLRFERWLSPDNKVVVLTVDRRFREQAYLLNEESGLWHDGIWYSNDGYRPITQARWYLNGVDWPAWDDRDSAGHRCEYCYAAIDPAEALCPICGWCLDCGSSIESCLCYIPPRSLGRSA